MSSAYNFPRHAAFNITTTDGKQCITVLRAAQRTRAPSTTTDKESKPTTVGSPTEQIEEGNSPAISTAIYNPHPAVTDASGNASDSNSRIIFSFTSIPTPEAISDSTTGPRQEHTAPTSTLSGIDDEIDSSTPAESSVRLSGPGHSSTNRNSAETNNAKLVSDCDGQSNTCAIVGGVFGFLILLALISIVIFFCWRRRKRKNQEPMLSPLGSAARDEFYEIDSRSLGPTKRSTRWKREISSRAENAAWDLKTTVVGFGTSIRATISKDRCDTPSIDLDRGNTQDFRGSFNQHQRKISSILTASTGRSTLRWRLAEWRKRLGEVWAPQMQGNWMNRPIFNVGLMPDSRVTSGVSRYRDSYQSGSTATEDLGLSLMDSQTSDLLKLENQPQDPLANLYADSFYDPKHGSLRLIKSIDRPFSNLKAGCGNPFSDSVITNPTSIAPKPQNYIQHVRRSPGSLSSTPSSNRSSSSTDFISFINRPTKVISTSQFPTAVAPSHTNDRDTFYSSFLAERRAKGRSDPFDLEKLKLWQQPSQQGDLHCLYQQAVPLQAPAASQA